MPGHDNIKTTAYIQAALLLANGCKLDGHHVNQSQFVEFDISVPNDEAARKATVISQIYGPGVAHQIRDCRDIIRNSTQPGGRKHHD